MLVQEPDGATTYSLFSKIAMKRFARSRASSRKPLLNAGWPQQVWSAGKSTSAPSLRSKLTTLIPTSGKNWSTKQVMNSETFISYQPTRQPVADQTEAGKTVLPSAHPPGSAGRPPAAARQKPTSLRLETH